MGKRKEIKFLCKDGQTREGRQDGVMFWIRIDHAVLFGGEGDMVRHGRSPPAFRWRLDLPRNKGPPRLKMS